jgi:hypothetical protein
LAGRLSPATHVRLAVLSTLVDKLRVPNLVEQYAAARTNAEQHLLSMMKQRTLVTSDLQAQERAAESGGSEAGA